MCLIYAWTCNVHEYRNIGIILSFYPFIQRERIDLYPLLIHKQIVLCHFKWFSLFLIATKKEKEKIKVDTLSPAICEPSRKSST